MSPVSDAGARTIWPEIVCSAAVLETGEREISNTLSSLQQKWTPYEKLSGIRKQGRDVSATLRLFKLKEVLPVIKAVVNGKRHMALVDFGCSRSLVTELVCNPWSQQTSDVLTVDVKTLRGNSIGTITLVVDNVSPVNRSLLGFHMLIGMDIIRMLGGVHIDQSGDAIFSRTEPHACATIRIEEPDFSAEFNVSATRMRQHLANFRLASKEPERLQNGALVLGLTVREEGKMLIWERGNEVPSVPQVLSRRSVFLFSGKLVRHFPVVKWLRVPAAFIERRAADIIKDWDDKVTDVPLTTMITEVVARVRQEDPVQGKWCVDGSTFGLMQVT